jgi:chromosome segregation ATPase
LIDVLLAVVGGLLALLASATAYAAVEYHKQLRRAQKEYEKARDTVESVVLSFNRELKREAENIQLVAFKVEGTSAKADTGLRKAESIEKRVAPLESQVSQLSTQLNTMSASSESSAQAMEKISGVDAKMRDFETSQEAMRNKLSGLEEQMQKLSSAPEARNETLGSMSVMPIKRDKAMAALTDTEVAVLEFLSAEGPKTAPEIKEKVHLSREHTARLMKKLYEEGYLERETGKLPFKYSLKKEMEKFLKKPDNPPAT